jgi:RNA polymerase sigma factor (sigma-70 family)
MAASALNPKQSSDPAVAEALCARIAAGERSAETELWHRYGRAVHNMLRRQISDVEVIQDLAQNCFEIALVQLRAGQVHTPAALFGFFQTVAQHQVSHYRRRAMRETPVDPETLVQQASEDPRQDPAALAAQQSNQRWVQEVLQELPTPRDRQLLWRYFVLDEPKAAICAALALDAIHFNRVLFRAKARLRERMSRRTGGEP